MAGYLHNMHPALPQPAARTNWLMARPPQQSSQHQPTQPPWSANWPGKQKSKRRSHKSQGDQEYFSQVFRKGKQQFHPMWYHGTTQYFGERERAPWAEKLIPTNLVMPSQVPEGNFRRKSRTCYLSFQKQCSNQGSEYQLVVQSTPRCCTVFLRGTEVRQYHWSEVRWVLVVSTGWRWVVD